MSSAFSAAFRDPETGKTRSVVLVIAGATLMARLDPGKAPGENAPHTATADFTPQLESIAAAIQHAAEELAEQERPYVCPEPMCAIVGDGPHVIGCPEDANENSDGVCDDDEPDSYDDSEGAEDE